MKFNIAIILLLLLLAGGIYYGVGKSVEQAAQIDVAPINTEPVKSAVAEMEPVDSILGIAEVPDSFNFDLKVIDGYTEVNWKFLSRVKFDEVFNEEMDAYIPYPVFHPTIKAYDGKKVQLSGYVIPIDETGDEKILVLSAFPYANCFFCGNAGPETVMDVQTKKNYKAMKMDQAMTFRGKLKLNDKDLYYLNYILEEAELVE